MKKNDIKEILKPLIKQCVKEMMFEEGILSGIISEVVQGLNSDTRKGVMESQSLQSAPAREQVKDNSLNEVRKKMLTAIGEDAYQGVDLFEGTEPMPSAGSTTPSGPASPLSNFAPSDPGVNIDGLFNLVGDKWNSLK